MKTSKFILQKSMQNFKTFSSVYWSNIISNALSVKCLFLKSYVKKILFLFVLLSFSAFKTLSFTQPNHYQIVAEINTKYPSIGVWKFILNTIVAEGNCVVTDVAVTDGAQQARAITFHTIKNGLIHKQVEFWPDNYEAPKWRSKWVKNIK